MPLHAAIILSDFHRGSFGIVGRLYEGTLKKVGLETHHFPTPSGESERVALGRKFPSGVFFHNTVGRSFAPVPGAINIAMVLHEWSRYPQEWIPYLSPFNEVWVTTHHLRRVLLSSGLDVGTFVIPPAIDLETYPQKSSWNCNTPFRFLYVGESHFRKGLHLLFAGWRKAFPRTGEAHLTIKTSPACPFDSPRSDISIISEQWDRSKILSLYPNYDCLISASLGEGWGLPIAEAQRAMLPVAANLWGGHESMLNSKNCFPIHHEEITQPYCSVPELYAEGQTCAFSDSESVAETLNEVIQSTQKNREKMAKRAFADLHQFCGYSCVKERVLERLEDLSSPLI